MTKPISNCAPTSKIDSSTAPKSTYVYSGIRVSTGVRAGAMKSIVYGSDGNNTEEVKKKGL